MKTQRLFFALWPSAPVRQAIVDMLAGLPPSIRGRNMQAHNLHITLHFLGQTTPEQRDCMHRAARSLKAAPFTFTLDRLGYFPRAKILWMGATTLPDELAQLHASLGAALTGCDYQVDSRHYQPHVTLKRKLAKMAPVADLRFSIPWPVDEFVLVESVPAEKGVDYRVIEKYPL